MILNEVKFISETLGLLSSMYVLLPQQKLAETQNKPRKKLRTLYLLHGHSDDHTAWQRFTSIERYVEGLNLAVVMPAVHLSFYNDMTHGLKCWQFISEEVPALVRDMFPLSSARKDNFAAGLSMGGYGAFKVALMQAGTILMIFGKGFVSTAVNFLKKHPTISTHHSPPRTHLQNTLSANILLWALPNPTFHPRRKPPGIRAALNFHPRIQMSRRLHC